MPRRNTEVTFIITDILPPSTNHAQNHTRKGYTYPSETLQEWLQECSLLKKQKIQKAYTYGVEYYIYYPFHYKNGNFKKQDTDNMAKYATDALVKQMVTYEGETIDDSRVKEHYIIGVNSKRKAIKAVFYVRSEGPTIPIEDPFPNIPVKAKGIKRRRKKKKS